MLRSIPDSDYCLWAATTPAIRVVAPSQIPAGKQQIMFQVDDQMKSKHRYE